MSSLIHDKLLGEYHKKCVRCGQCRYVCPVLPVVGKEPASPRGKVYLAGLMQKGRVAPGTRTDEILSLCLTCGACTAECPSGLPVDGIIAAARAMSASARPYTAERFALRSFFSGQRWIEKIPLFIPVLRLILARGSGIRSGPPARSYIPAVILPEKRKPRLKVGYFLGCATNYLLPGVALSVVGVLRHLGCEVYTPPLACCGLPLKTAGETGLAARLRDENSRRFSVKKLDCLITDCSSCSYHLTEAGFSGNSQPVYEFNEFLTGVINPPAPSGNLGGESVTIHDPCHLRFGRKVTGPCREVLGIIPGINLVEIPGGSTCCGGGGAFSLKHPSISSDILKNNSRRIIDSGASKVATVCPSCLIQISRGLRPSPGISVSHPAQLLHASYGLSQ